MGPDELSGLIAQHGAALVLFACQWCRTPEDVVQEAFVKLIGQPTPPANAAAWLYACVRNGALMAARAERRRQAHEAVVAANEGRWFTATDCAARDAALALAALPIEQREVIVAHLWGRLTFVEIGALAGSSAATAHRRYAEGLAALRRQMGAVCLPNPQSTPN